ncbi:Protein BIG GRAIN 1-like B [Hirschfeldia incana]|nr:Protein BIG GRAIN 1-like B [Hirschfeldia incana]
MDPWDNHQYRHPSFSSTLLDQIYRSTDSSSSSDVSMRKKQNRAADENRVCLEKILANRRKTAADDFLRSRTPKTVEHSSSTSSDSSGLSSSSSSDSFYRRTRSSPAIHHPPKPIRTSVERLERPNNNNNNNKVKSKALKMYSDLKKVKQPISPGGRLATFLNSLFTGNTKKPDNKTATSSSTTCSSASSFSRSCLSKTTSSSEKTKRSVRFCPVNVILDENSSRESRVMEENRRVIEAAKELIRTYQKSKDVVNISVEEEEDDEDDGASCASSDLFELDNLSAIGIGRYREELPVYETTRLNTNRIISG